MAKRAAARYALSTPRELDATAKFDIYSETPSPLPGYEHATKMVLATPPGATRALDDAYYNSSRRRLYMRESAQVLAAHSRRDEPSTYAGSSTYGSSSRGPRTYYE